MPEQRADPFATDTASPYSASLDTTTLPAGAHTLSAKAVDTAGNPSAASVSITVDNTAPTISITSPAGGSTVKKGTTVTIAAAASDAGSGVQKVEFLVSGKLTCADSAAPYTCAWSVPKGASKTYSLTARAHDNAGFSTLSSAISVKSG